MREETISGKDIIEGCKIQAFELVIMMAAGLDGVNRYGEHLQRTANKLVWMDSNLFHHIVILPEDKFTLFKDDDYSDAWPHIPQRYKFGYSGGINRELFYSHLDEFSFDKNAVDAVTCALGYNTIATSHAGDQDDVTPKDCQAGDAPIAESQDVPVVEAPEKVAKTTNNGGLAAMATAWGEISIVFVNDYSIEIHCNGATANKTFDEIGFSDGRRKDEPNMRWLLLKQFAENRGELLSVNDISKSVSNLRKALKLIFPHLADNPIEHNKQRQTYISAFAINSRIPHE